MHSSSSSSSWSIVVSSILGSEQTFTILKENSRYIISDHYSKNTAKSALTPLVWYVFGFCVNTFHQNSVCIRLQSVVVTPLDNHHRPGGYPMAFVRWLNRTRFLSRSRTSRYKYLILVTLPLDSGSSLRPLLPGIHPSLVSCVILLSHLDYFLFLLWSRKSDVVVSVHFPVFPECGSEIFLSDGRYSECSDRSLSDPTSDSRLEEKPTY